jgi:hypothetical protein
MSLGRATSVFLLQQSPPGGIWVPPRYYGRIDLTKKWIANNGRIVWEPCEPPDAAVKIATINRMVFLLNKQSQIGSSAFLRFSGTSKTGVTWSLPPVASCPVLDEGCGNCYALDGWYRTNISAQVGRVLRLEYLRSLTSSGRLDIWINWAIGKISRLPPIEHVPLQPLRRTLEAHLRDVDLLTSPIPYFRWHDSGDLFNKEYAKAVLEVCRQTPRVLHWLPTRMGGLISRLVAEGTRIPNNLTIQVSAHRGGLNEALQRDAVSLIARCQPEARVGISYTFEGSASRVIDPKELGAEHKDGILCPASVATKREDRKCAGCRHCWVDASVERPVVYAIHRGS